ncbi:hypothetical protein HanPI659440_Chr02g0084871 [Helianthus annuus]|nr:hypothetical protein HanPI659440_Chr02g0084871 [Helianthus annuus]
MFIMQGSYYIQRLWKLGVTQETSYLFCLLYPFYDPNRFPYQFDIWVELVNHRYLSLEAPDSKTIPYLLEYK